MVPVAVSGVEEEADCGFGHSLLCLVGKGGVGSDDDGGDKGACLEPLEAAEDMNNDAEEDVPRPLLAAPSIYDLPEEAVHNEEEVGLDKLQWEEVGDHDNQPRDLDP